MRDGDDVEAKAFVVVMVWFAGLGGGAVVNAQGFLAAGIIGWPVVLVIPAITYALPHIFAPWSTEARLQRRIARAKRDQRLIDLRRDAERAESAASHAIDAYIEDTT